MTKSKNTKRALLASVLSMLLCVAMLVGSTFAWFTDSVTSGKNKIVAGNLDIELNYRNASMTSFKEVKADTEDLFVTKEGEVIRWEPGAAAVTYLELKNAGTLALKYQLSVDAADTVTGTDGAALSEVLKTAVVEITEAEVGTYDRATAVQKAEAADAEGILTYSKPGEMETQGQVKYLAMIVYFPAEIGNTYEGAVYNRSDVELKTELSLNLVATQTPYENDSFGNNYDENAEYPPVEVATVNDLKKAFENGGNIKLTSEIAIPDILEIPADAEVVLDLNGKTITSDNSGTVGQNRPIVNYGTLVIKGNGTIDTTDATGYGAIRNYGTLTIEDGTFKGSGLGGGSAVDNQAGGTTTINGGTYYATGAVMNRAGGTMIINSGDFEGVTNANEKYSSGNWSYAIRNYGDMTINDCNMHGSMNGGVACDQGTITINGGYFKVEDPEGSSQSYYVLLTNRRTSSKIIVNGGTFEQTNGTDRLLGGFSGMPSWDATTDLEANGFTINGGTFILNGETVTIP